LLPGKVIELAEVVNVTDGEAEADRKFQRASNAVRWTQPRKVNKAQRGHEQPSQKTAEEVGDRILKRLHEARDVAPIFREYFVSDASMRRREVQLVFGRRLPRNRGQIEHAAIVRASSTPTSMRETGPPSKRKKKPQMWNKCDEILDCQKRKRYMSSSGSFSTTS
jgi:hypothetical protein